MSREALMATWLTSILMGRGAVAVSTNEEGIHVEEIDINSDLSGKQVIIAHPENESLTQYAENNNLMVLLQTKLPLWDIHESCQPECWYDIDYKVTHEPAPRKIVIKQAPRQSFRQSMRSVNRNR